MSLERNTCSVEVALAPWQRSLPIYNHSNSAAALASQVSLLFSLSASGVINEEKVIRAQMRMKFNLLIELRNCNITFSPQVCSYRICRNSYLTYIYSELFCFFYFTTAGPTHIRSTEMNDEDSDLSCNVTLKHVSGNFIVGI